MLLLIMIIISILIMLVIGIECLLCFRTCFLCFRLTWSLPDFLYFGCHSLCAAAFNILVLRDIMQGLNALKDDGWGVIEEMLLAFVKTLQMLCSAMGFHKVLPTVHRALKVLCMAHQAHSTIKCSPVLSSWLQGTYSSGQWLPARSALRLLSASCVKHSLFPDNWLCKELSISW